MAFPERLRTWLQRHPLKEPSVDRATFTAQVMERVSQEAQVPVAVSRVNHRATQAHLTALQCLRVLSWQLHRQRP